MVWGSRSHQLWHSAGRDELWFHWAGTWWWDMDWRMCKILLDLSPQAGRTGLEGAITKVSSLLPYLQMPCRNLCRPLQGSCCRWLEGLVRLLLSRDMVPPQLGAISNLIRRISKEELAPITLLGLCLHTVLALGGTLFPLKSHQVFPACSMCCCSICYRGWGYCVWIPQAAGFFCRGCSILGRILWGGDIVEYSSPACATWHTAVPWDVRADTAAKGWGIFWHSRAGGGEMPTGKSPRVPLGPPQGKPQSQAEPAGSERLGAMGTAPGHLPAHNKPGLTSPAARSALCSVWALAVCHECPQPLLHSQPALA